MRLSLNAACFAVAVIAFAGHSQYAMAGDSLAGTPDFLAHLDAAAPALPKNLHLATGGAERDTNVAHCDALTSGYEFRDVLDARGNDVVALEDMDYKAALAACGAALDTYPDHLRSRFHYARAMDASSVISFYPAQHDPEILPQAMDLYAALCADKLAIACHNLGGFKLQLGQFTEGQAVLEAGCQMDKTAGAGHSCAKLGNMYEAGHIGQKKTLKLLMPFIRVGVNTDHPVLATKLPEGP